MRRLLGVVALRLLRTTGTATIEARQELLQISHCEDGRAIWWRRVSERRQAETNSPAQQPVKADGGGGDLLYSAQNSRVGQPQRV